MKHLRILLRYKRMHIMQRHAVNAEGQLRVLSYPLRVYKTGVSLLPSKGIVYLDAPRPAELAVDRSSMTCYTVYMIYTKITVLKTKTLRSRWIWALIAITAPPANDSCLPSTPIPLNP